jgi:hypothetical protein
MSNEDWITIQGDLYLKSAITRVGKTTRSNASHTDSHYLLIDAGGITTEYNMAYKEDLEKCQLLIIKNINKVTE